MGMDWKKVERVRRSIERRDYSHPAFLISSIETDFDRFSDRLLRDIHEGKKFEQAESGDVVSKILPDALFNLQKFPERKANRNRGSEMSLRKYSRTPPADCLICH